MDQAQLKYQTSKTVNLDVLEVHGASQPDDLVKFPGIIHEMLDGTLASQNAGSRQLITMKFQVMSDANVRKAVDWWAADDSQIVSLVSAPGKPAGTSTGSGGLDGDYLYKCAAVDVVGSSACGTVSDSISAHGGVTVPLTWTASTGARLYKVFRSSNAGANWDLVDYTNTNSYTDLGATVFKAGVTPPSSATTWNIVTDGDFKLEWMFGTELARMLTVQVRVTSIFLKADGFPV